MINSGNHKITIDFGNLNVRMDKTNGIIDNSRFAIRNSEINVDKYIEFVNKEIEAGKIKPIDPRQLIVNIIALCIFPIIGRPIIQIIAFNDDKKAYDAFLDTRKKEVTELIINSIKI